MYVYIKFHDKYIYIHYIKYTCIYNIFIHTHVYVCIYYVCMSILYTGNFERSFIMIMMMMMMMMTMMIAIILIKGSSMVFHALIFAWSRGSCYKPWPKYTKLYVSCKLPQQILFFLFIYLLVRKKLREFNDNQYSILASLCLFKVF